MMENETDEIIQRCCVNEKQKRFYNFKGCFLTHDFDQRAHEIENFHVRDTDVWVTSFPKSGTTWTQEMVWLLANNLDYEGAKTCLSKRFPFLEISALFDLTDMEDRPDTITYTNSLKIEPRCIKSHLPWFLLPREIQSKEKRPKIIHVARNSKDACVSYFHHYKHLHSYNGNFEEFCKIFLADKVQFAPYWANILSYWEQRNEPNVLFIRYEDMKNDLRGVVQNVATFLNKDINDEQMEKLLIHLSFDSMRNNSAVNYENSPSVKTSNFHFIRKGILGDYKSLMTPEIIEQFEEWIEKKNPGLNNM